MEDKVVDSRESREGDAIRRRRECLRCARRFTSYERLEEVPILIVKKDGRREPFDRQKLLRGIMAACQKRPVSLARQEEIVGDVQARLVEQPDREVASRALGEMVMDALKLTDSVAYVRFASVYRDFKDLPDFFSALEGLMAQGAPVPRLATAREPGGAVAAREPGGAMAPRGMEAAAGGGAPRTRAPQLPPPRLTRPARPVPALAGGIPPDPAEGLPELPSPPPGAEHPSQQPLFPGVEPPTAAPKGRKRH